MVTVKYLNTLIQHTLKIKVLVLNISYSLLDYPMQMYTTPMNIVDIFAILLKKKLVY